MNSSPIPPFLVPSARPPPDAAPPRLFRNTLIDLHPALALGHNHITRPLPPTLPPLPSTQHPPAQHVGSTAGRACPHAHVARGACLPRLPCQPQGRRRQGRRVRRRLGSGNGTLLSIVEFPLHATTETLSPLRARPLSPTSQLKSKAISISLAWLHAGWRLPSHSSPCAQPVTSPASACVVALRRLHGANIANPSAGQL